MVGNRNFYRFQKIKSKIMNYDYKDSDKDLMFHTIYYFSSHSSSENFLEEFHLQNKDWKKIIKKFDKLNAAPFPFLGHTNFLYIRAYQFGMSVFRPAKRLMVCIDCAPYALRY